MLQRQPHFWRKAANDNHAPLPDRNRVAARVARQPAPGKLSDGTGLTLRPVLVLAFAGLTLVVLCVAFLLGLAAVGLLAVAVCGIELVRRRVWRPAKPVLGSFDRRAIGY